MKKTITQILEEASKEPTREGKIRVLRENDSYALRVILQYCFDPNIKWLLPKGRVPYKPSEFLDNEGIIYSEARRFYLFVEGGNANLSQTRREVLFIQLLETLDKRDAALLEKIKDKKMPIKGITYKLVKETFSEILPDVQVEEKTA